ncbi:DNA polymerase Y family protein [Streptomyces luteireticuli]|uniref:UmuC domain-containing protein n=1 Tax=Streptomyces luteireticuli TaxID=173858 RepID=A0ABP3ITH8_9ACTN
MTTAPRTILHVRAHLPADAGSALYEQILDLLRGITPHVQPLPPADAHLDITGAARYWAHDTHGLAVLAKARLLAHHGIQATLGAGPNRMIAAMAADAAEPGGIAVIGPGPDAVRAFLRPRPAAALHGIGPATAKTLTRHGIHTIGHLADTPALTLQRLLGTTTGRALHHRALGHDPRPVIAHTTARSLSAEHRFPHDELDPAEHRRALLALTEHLGHRLRTDAHVTGALTLTVHYADRTTTTRTRSFTEATHHGSALTTAAYTLYTGLGLQRARVRTLALRAEHLSPADQATHQLTLDPGDDKARRIEAAADAARRRFGPTAVKPASLAQPL